MPLFWFCVPPSFSHDNDLTPHGTPYVYLSARDRSIAASWGEPAERHNPPTRDHGSPVTSHQVWYKESTSNTWTNVNTGSAVRNYTITGLSNGKSYNVAVNSINAHGVGGISYSNFSIFLPTSKPQSPTNVSGEAGDSSVKISWTFSNTSGSAITKWQYRQQTNGNNSWGSWKDICETTETNRDCPRTRKYTVADLTNGTSYKFQLRGENRLGFSLESDESDSVTPSTTPSKPTGLTVAGANGSVTLSWTSESNGGSAITGWKYIKNVSNSWDSDWTVVPNSGANTTSYKVPNLTNGTVYKFKVRAVNANGDGTESDESASVTPNVETLTASSVEATTATLTIASFTGDWWYKYTSPTGGSCSSNAVTTMSVDLIDLSSNTNYTFKAYSDSNCSIELASETFLTKPGKPTKPMAVTGAGTGKLTKWQYQQKSGGSFGSWQNISGTSTNLNHVVTGLTDGTSYQFKVRAVNASGDGVESDESDSETPTAVTLTITAHATDNTKATLTIGNFAGDWWYKHTSPDGGVCTSVVSSGTTVNLTNLLRNTFYVYKAYSDNICSTVLATTTYQTKLDTALRNQAVKDGLAAVGRGILSSVDMSLGSRLRGKLGEGMKIAGHTLPSHSVGSNYSDRAHLYVGDSDKEIRVKSLDWLEDTYFAVPLNSTGSEAGAGNTTNLIMWAHGDIQSLRAERSSIDGELRRAYVGFDTKQSDGGLLGAALSYSRGDADYTYESTGSSESGQLRTSLTIIHPYLSWHAGENSTLWTILGLGRGDIEDRRTSSVERGDLSMSMISFGGSHDLTSTVGQVELVLLGDAAILRMKAKSDSPLGMLDAASSTVRRLRFGLEGSYDIRKDRGVWSPFGQVSARYDSGDGDTGSGAEIAGGMRYRSSRLMFELGGRELRASGGNYQSHGWNVGFEFMPSEFGEGLSLSLYPSWGESGYRSTETLWGSDALSTPETAKAATSAPRLKAKIGYGFRSPTAPALLTPYAEHDHLTSGSRRLCVGLGIRLEYPATRFDIDLRGELVKSPDTKDERTGVFLDALLRF